MDVRMNGGQPVAAPGGRRPETEQAIAALAQRVDDLDRALVEQREFAVFSSARLERLLQLGLERLERKLDALLELLAPRRRA